MGKGEALPKHAAGVFHFCKAKIKRSTAERVQHSAVLGERENKNEKRSCPFEKANTRLSICIILY